MKYLSLLDGDILAHELGQSVIHSQPITWREAKYNCDKKVQDIMDQAGCDDVRIFLTDSESNFRHKVATIKPYKGNRNDDIKPAYWSSIREHLIDEHGAEVVFGYEADDKLAMEQHHGEGADTVLCSRDKDLDQVQGYHYSWECGRQKEKPIYYISEEEGLRLFYLQLIMGDPGDNIPGLYGVGKYTANKKLKACIVPHLRPEDIEKEMYKMAQKMYEDRFGSYWELFLVENARLLYLLRSEDDVWELPVSLKHT